MLIAFRIIHWVRGHLAELVDRVLAFIVVVDVGALLWGVDDEVCRPSESAYRPSESEEYGWVVQDVVEDEEIGAAIEQRHLFAKMPVRASVYVIVVFSRLPIVPVVIIDVYR